MTLLLLLDAFRPDYLQHTPFIRSLAQESATGFMRECFGFLPRAAYFGGLDAGQSGFTNMYCFDPENSVFSSTRALSAHYWDATPERQSELRQFVDQRARERLPAFAKHYVSSAQIPLGFLPFFDLVEKRAPWDARVGYKSLFALLDKKNIAWHQCAWPETNYLAEHTDQAIVRHTLAELQPEHRFAYVHLQELDGTGHVHGPNSAALQNRLTDTDRLCRELIEALRQRYTTVNVVIFGDHGMVNITRTLDVATTLASTQLKFGVDFAYFLDSTMVRFWFYHRRAKAAIIEAFQNVPGGHILSEAEMQHFGIAECDRRNAEMIFLADPGVLLFPNFFQGEGEPIKGMHGYDPDCPDNLGFFLVHNANRPEWAAGSVGKVNPPELFPLVLELMGFNAAEYTPTKAPAISSADKTEDRFTSHPELAAEQLVQNQLKQIADKIESRVGKTEAIVLSGSFGRGEGGVFKDTSGQYHPVNDYDLLVVDSRDLSGPLKGLGNDFARELGIDFVDLGYSDGRWENLPLTVFNYDLKHGSRVIAGNPAVLDRIPAYASAEMPIYEAVKLLLNRTAGMLSGMRGNFLTGEKPLVDEQRYLTNQIVKALLAIGDWHLLRWGGYDSSYSLRRQRFAALTPGAGIAADSAARIDRAFQFKCLPDYSQFSHGLNEIKLLLPEWEKSVVDSINLLTEGHAQNLAAVMQGYLKEQSSDAGWVKSDNHFCAAHPEMQGLLRPDRPANVSLRHLIYSVLPMLFKAGFENEPTAIESLRQTTLALQPFFILPAEPATGVWEHYRKFVVKAWFALCH